MAGGSFWLLEGSAEWVGYRAQTDTGVIPYATVKDCQIRNVIAGTPLPVTLSSLENSSVFYSTPGAMYGLAFLGIDVATGSRGASALSGLWNAQAEWHPAFLSAFGTTTAAFYTAFEQIRTTWRTTLTSQCFN